jgi:hypothetical protein
MEKNLAFILCEGQVKYLAAYEQFTGQPEIIALISVQQEIKEVVLESKCPTQP